MKKLFPFIIIILIIIGLASCGEDKTYYEQFNNDQPFVSRILNLNKPIDEIRLQEKGNLIKEDLSLLVYVYKIGKTDTYEVSYLFDEKGCYEIGIDGYFEFKKDAVDVVAGIQNEMAASKYGKGSDDNNLNRWKNKDNSIAVELDYKDTSRGLFVATIFANK